MLTAPLPMPEQISLYGSTSTVSNNGHWNIQQSVPARQQFELQGADFAADHPVGGPVDVMVPPSPPLMHKRALFLVKSCVTCLCLRAGDLTKQRFTRTLGSVTYRCSRSDSELVLARMHGQICLS